VSLKRAFGGGRREASEADMASYTVNDRAVARAERMIDARQYVLDSDWGEVQPSADEWRHKQIELAAHELLQRLDARSA